MDNGAPYPRSGSDFPHSQGATSGPGRDAECAVVHPAHPSFEKSHPGGLYDASSRDKSAGRGVYGEPGFEPPAIYLKAVCRCDRVLPRGENDITAGRDRAVRRVAKQAAGAKPRRPDLVERLPELVEWAIMPLPREQVGALIRRK